MEYDNSVFMELNMSDPTQARPSLQEDSKTEEGRLEISLPAVGVILSRGGMRPLLDFFVIRWRLKK